MTFYEKYPQLQDKIFLAQILTDTVFSTMLLEDQQVSKSRIHEIVMSLLNDRELKSGKFIGNKIA